MSYVLKKVEARNPFMSIQGRWGANEAFNDFIGKKLLLNCGWYYQDGFSWWLGEEDSYFRARLWFIRHLKKDNNYGKKYFYKHYSNLRKFVNSFSDLVETAQKCPTANAILQANKFIRRATTLIAPAFFTDWYAYNAQNWIYGYVSRKKMGDDNFRLLTAGKKLSFVKEYECRLAKIKLRIGRNNKEDIIRNMPWVKDNYYYHRTVTATVIKNDLRQMSIKQAENILSLAPMLVKKNKRQKKLLKSLRLGSFQESLLDLFSDFVDLQDIRKAVVFVTNNVAWSYFNKILDFKKITGIDKKMVLEHASAEWILTLEKKDLLFRSRQAKLGMLKLGYQSELLGQSGKNRFNQLVEEFSRQKEISGYAAQLGKARGYVKIVNRVADFQDFKIGSVLVASMTRPEFTPVLKKCSAIITDEGGITSHAAIIAREMKKPCIIGTKIATRVLKDGDLVEVDAAKGTVKIIKRG